MTRRESNRDRNNNSNHQAISSNSTTISSDKIENKNAERSNNIEVYDSVIVGTALTSSAVINQDIETASDNIGND